MKHLLFTILCLLCTAPVAHPQVLKPTPLSAAVPLPNPLSGSYASVSIGRSKNFQAVDPRYVDAATLPSPVQNIYGRLSWAALETAQGHYDFSAIDNMLLPCLPAHGNSACLPKGVKFGFRVMALDPQVASNTNVLTGDRSAPLYSELPSYLTMPQHGWELPVNAQNPSAGYYFVPDWNDPFFLARLKALLAALGAKYDGDPRIGWVDIGIYGSWGEWHTTGFPDRTDYPHGIPYDATSPDYNFNLYAHAQNKGSMGAYHPASKETKDFIVDSYVAAFPKTLLLSLTDDGEGLCHALHSPGSATHIGLRRDSLGAALGWSGRFPANLPNCDGEDDQALILSRWQSAPFITEAFGNGSSTKFPCQTFQTDTNGFYDIIDEVRQYHVAAIKNGSICKGAWADLTADEQRIFLAAVAQAGYRIAPAEVNITASSTRLKIKTDWVNGGVTPAYDPWKVEYSLWTLGDAAKLVASFDSAVDLRDVYPGLSSPLRVSESFSLSTRLPARAYMLRLRASDPTGYMNPLRLALAKTPTGGYYDLGEVNIEPTK